MDAKEIATEIAQHGIAAFGRYSVSDYASRLAPAYLLLCAENEALKKDVVNWSAWCETVAAKFFNSDRFGTNDIWLAIADLIRQRDEAQQDIADLKADLSRTADCEDKALARAETAESQRETAASNAVHFMEKCATLETQNAAMREMVTTTDHSKECALYHSWRIGTTCNCWKSAALSALQPAPES